MNKRRVAMSLNFKWQTKFNIQFVITNFSKISNK